MAAKRSRDARRMKENQIALRAGFLEKEVPIYITYHVILFGPNTRQMNTKKKNTKKYGQYFIIFRYLNR